MKVSFLFLLLTGVVAVASGPLRQGRAAAAASPQQKIATCLWFSGDAEAAIRFYVSVFPDGRILDETRFGDGGPKPRGSLMAATFELAGQEFHALNGGPPSGFTPAISLQVRCRDQAEIDGLWEKLGKDGQPGQCGWLEDRYGFSWQIVPATLGAMLQDRDPARAKRVAEAMMRMRKLDIRRLEEAYGSN